MNDNLYTTKTAALKATTADVRKLNTKEMVLNGKNILDYFSENKTIILDERGETASEKDLWGTTVTSDADGVVQVSHNFLTNPNAYNNAAWDSTVTKVENNKAYQGENFYCNIQTDMIKDGSWMFRDLTNFISFESDLSSLQNGSAMFSGTSNLNTFTADLSSLIVGENMFYKSNLICFGSSLHNLQKGKSMFASSKLQSIESDFSNLVDGQFMFYFAPLHAIIAKSGFPKLENGFYMFSFTKLQHFDFDISNLKDGSLMFKGSSLYTFNSPLYNLKNGSQMFELTHLSSFQNNLSSLEKANYMFSYAQLENFSSNLNSLDLGGKMFEECNKLNTFKTNNLNNLRHAGEMFKNTSIEEFIYDLPALVQGMNMFFTTPDEIKVTTTKLVDGVPTSTTENIFLPGLKKFRGSLPSLQCGYHMFSGCKLDEDSIMIIADTINDINEIKANNSWDPISDHSFMGVGGILHINYDSTICDVKKVDKYCTEIMNKGWTVYLNGTLQTSDEGIEGIATLAEDGTIAIIPVPYYYKSKEVPKEYAEWTDGEKYYIILGGQKIFGDDLSNYGMFTSMEDAAANMRLTSYKYVKEEQIIEEI